jgi:general secretion pathway protein H
LPIADITGDHYMDDPLVLRLLKKSRLANVLGYTLMELLIVVFIISIITSVVGLRISFNQPDVIRNVTQSIYETLTLAQEEAILESNILKLVLKDSGGDFFIWKDEQFAKLETHLRFPPLPNNIKWRVKTHQEKMAPATILFFNNGELTPFSLDIGENKNNPLYRIVGYPDGRINYYAL